jgi:hypothetical protein
MQTPIISRPSLEMQTAEYFRKQIQSIYNGVEAVAFNAGDICSDSVECSDDEECSDDDECTDDESIDDAPIEVSIADTLALAHAIRHSPSLKRIAVQDFLLHPFGLLEFMMAVRDSSVVDVDISGNPDIGGYILGALPAMQHRLVSLQLYDNDLDDTHCACILHILQHAPLLETLNLGANRAWIQTARRVALVLETNTVLQRMYLHMNFFDEACAAIIAPALSANQTLKYFDTRNEDVCVNREGEGRGDGENMGE